MSAKLGNLGVYKNIFNAVSDYTDLSVKLPNGVICSVS